MFRRIFRLVIGGLAGLVLLVPTTTASAATTWDFVGLWTSVDAVDGSDQIMFINPGRRIMLFDTSATACDDDAPAIVTGRGTISGDDLDATLEMRCIGGGGLSGVDATFSYDSGDDTLTDDMGGAATVWSRA
ncbi:MAG: hypothetical protein ACLFWR_10125 [Acidimicrobiales bacterium]